MPKSFIPFGSEFSPAVIELPELLVMVKQLAPDRTALTAAIDKKFFPGKGSSGRKTLGDNTVLSMLAYGVLDRDSADKFHSVHMTDFGEALYVARSNDTALRQLVGRHCLTSLPGMTLVSILGDLRAAGTMLNKLSIARALREQGYHYPENGKHLNVMRQWLEFAGIVNPDQKDGGPALWHVSDARVQELIGVSAGDIDSLGKLTEPQRRFAQVFAAMKKDEAVASDVRKAVESLYGIQFPEGGLPQSILNPLQVAGLITTEKTTGGRGAKSHIVHATSLLKSAFIQPILKQSNPALGKAFKLLTRMPIEDIVNQLSDPNKSKKGIALEALALYFMRLLDLEYVMHRLRSADTGGSEVDLLVEGSRLIFSRWQIQCKNTKTLSLEDVAKEVGVATAYRSNVVMMVTTGSPASTVDHFVRTVMENSSIQVVIIDGQEVKRIVKSPTHLMECLHQQARTAMALKRKQLKEN